MFLAYDGTFSTAKAGAVGPVAARPISDKNTLGLGLNFNLVLIMHIRYQLLKSSPIVSQASLILDLLTS